jgi:hypothetical protein
MRQKDSPDWLADLTRHLASRFLRRFVSNLWRRLERAHRLVLGCRIGRAGDGGFHLRHDTAARWLRETPALRRVGGSNPGQRRSPQYIPPNDAFRALPSPRISLRSPLLSPSSPAELSTAGPPTLLANSALSSSAHQQHLGSHYPGWRGGRVNEQALRSRDGGVWAPGGPRGLQHRRGRATRPGGFDPRPPPPDP